MLRITLVPGSEPSTLKVEGKLSGPWVTELERSWSEISRRETPRPVVDLSDVTFVSAEGKKLLKFMFQQGAHLQSRSLMTQFILSQLQTESKSTATPRETED
jgi:anti-anti-sigma regulatory factor